MNKYDVLTTQNSPVLLNTKLPVVLINELLKFLVFDYVTELKKEEDKFNFLTRCFCSIYVFGQFSAPWSPRGEITMVAWEISKYRLLSGKELFNLENPDIFPTTLSKNKNTT